MRIMLLVLRKGPKIIYDRFLTSFKRGSMEKKNGVFTKGVHNYNHYHKISNPLFTITYKINIDKFSIRRILANK